MLAAGLPDMIMTDDNNSSITRRKLLGSMAIVGAASAGAGAGTYAYITDNETASFSFQSGSIVLKIEPGTVDFTASSGSQDDGSEMTDELTISNKGTLDVSTLELTGIDLSGPEDLQKAAEITTFQFTAPMASGANDLTDDLPGNLFDLSDTLQESPLELGSNSESLLAPMGDPATLEVGITYNYANVETNDGMLSAEFNFAASQ